MSTNVTSPESKAHAKHLSEESTVLLKNDDNLLPLNLKHNEYPSGILVIGNGKHATEPTTHGSGSG